MNEGLLLGIFGVFVTALFAMAGAIYILSQRVTKMETIFNFWIDTIGRKAAQLLHSPDDHHGLDKYLEKYLGDHPSLNLEDWYTIKRICGDIENDNKLDSGKRFIAGFVAAGAAQKILLWNKGVSMASELRINPEIKP